VPLAPRVGHGAASVDNGAATRGAGRAPVRACGPCAARRGGMPRRPHRTSAPELAAAFGPVRPTQQPADGPRVLWTAGGQSSCVSQESRVLGVALLPWRMSSGALSCTQVSLSWVFGFVPAGPNYIFYSLPL
jgi:hypothetical protein